MTHADIRAQYIRAQLASVPGDGELRYRLFAPLLKNLWKDRVVYREKFAAIVRLHNLEINSEGFRGVAIPLITMSSPLNIPCPNRPWDFSATWNFVTLLENCLWVRLTRKRLPRQAGQAKL